MVEPEDLDRFQDALDKFQKPPIPPDPVSPLLSIPRPKRASSEVGSLLRVVASPKTPDEGDWDVPPRKRSRSASGSFLMAAALGPDLSTDRDLAPCPDSTIDQFFKMVGRTGQTHLDWMRIREPLLWKLECVCREMSRLVPAPPSARAPAVDVLLAHVRSFTGIPFTIQRLCELITTPLRHYRRVDKFLRAVEKNVKVITTVGPTGARETSFRRPSVPPVSVLPIVPVHQENEVIMEEESPTTESNGEKTPPADAAAPPASSSPGTPTKDERDQSDNLQVPMETREPAVQDSES